MKKPAFALMVLWIYLLVASYYGIESYSGAAMNNLGAWQLMLASALIVPVLASVVVFAAQSNSDESEAKIRFIESNRKQLKIYGLGVLLLIIIIGGAVMVGAAIWGVLINAFFLTSSFVRRLN